MPSSRIGQAHLQWDEAEKHVPVGPGPAKRVHASRSGGCHSEDAETIRGVRTVRVAILGLDSVPPELLFDRLLDKLPNIKKMTQRGIYGKLTTCDPPITVPAWMVMFTGKNPGKLGIY